MGLTNYELRALIAGAERITGPGLLLPSRNSEVLRWCLAGGLKVVQPMTLMSLGLHNEPSGGQTAGDAITRLGELSRAAA